MGLKNWLYVKCLKNIERITKLEVIYEIVSESGEVLSRRTEFFSPEELTKHTIFFDGYEGRSKAINKIRKDCSKMLTDKAHEWLKKETKEVEIVNKNSVFFSKYAAGVTWDMYIEDTEYVTPKEFETVKAMKFGC